MKKWYIALTTESDLASTNPDRRPSTDAKYIIDLLFNLIIIPSLKNPFPRKWKLFCWSHPTTTPVKHKKVQNFPHTDHLFVRELIVLMDHFYLDVATIIIIISISQVKKISTLDWYFFNKSMHRTGTQKDFQEEKICRHHKTFPNPFTKKKRKKKANWQQQYTKHCLEL